MEKSVILSDGRKVVFTGCEASGRDGLMGNGWITVNYKAVPTLVRKDGVTKVTKAVVDLYSEIIGELEDAAVDFLVKETGQERYRTFSLTRSIIAKNDLVFQVPAYTSFNHIGVDLEFGDIELMMADFTVIVKYKVSGFEGLSLTSIVKKSPLWNQLYRDLKRYLFSKGYQAELYGLEEIAQDHFYLDKSSFTKKPAV